jgi:hypothetical protein
MTPQDQWLSQKERILAWFRLGFAIVAVLVIQLNPSRVARFPLLSHVSLGSFVLYSIALLYIALHRRTALEKIGIAANCFDLIWVSLIVFSTGGSNPILCLLFFPSDYGASVTELKVALAQLWRELHCMGTFVSTLTGRVCLGWIVS